MVSIGKKHILVKTKDSYVYVHPDHLSKWQKRVHSFKSIFPSSKTRELKEKILKFVCEENISLSELKNHLSEQQIKSVEVHKKEISELKKQLIAAEHNYWSDFFRTTFEKRPERFDEIKDYSLITKPKVTKKIKESVGKEGLKLIISSPELKKQFRTEILNVSRNKLDSILKEADTKHIWAERAANLVEKIFLTVGEEHEDIARVLYDEFEKKGLFERIRTNEHGIRKDFSKEDLGLYENGIFGLSEKKK